MSFDFDGNDYISIPNCTFVASPRQVVTLTAWVYASTTADVRTILWASTDGSSTTQRYSVKLVGNDDMKQEGRSDDSEFEQDEFVGSPVTSQEWTLVAATIDLVNDEFVHRFINESDGSNKETASETFNDTTFETGASASTFIGARPSSTQFWGAGGRMEDIRFYDRALTDDEVLTMYYSRGSDQIVSGLMGQYHALHMVAAGTEPGVGFDIPQSNGTLRFDGVDVGGTDFIEGEGFVNRRRSC